MEELIIRKKYDTNIVFISEIRFIFRAVALPSWLCRFRYTQTAEPTAQQEMATPYLASGSRTRSGKYFGTCSEILANLESKKSVFLQNNLLL